MRINLGKSKNIHIVQCAALKIHRSLMISPPQRSVEYSNKAACHGFSSIVVSKPPTIFDDESVVDVGIVDPAHGAIRIYKNFKVSVEVIGKLLLPATIVNEMTFTNSMHKNTAIFESSNYFY